MISTRSKGLGEILSMKKKAMTAILMVSILLIALPETAMVGVGAKDEVGMEKDIVVGSTHDTSTSSRYKEFPNTDTWEWVNPVPNHNKLNDVMWQPGGDVAVIVGHSGSVTEREGTVWTTVQTNTIYNLWHVEWRPSGDYALVVGNNGVVIKYISEQATHLDAGTITRLQGVAWKSDGSYALICGWDGLLMKYDGNDFTTIDSGTKNRLYNVSYDNTAGWLISGEHGTLLTYEEVTGVVTQVPTGIDDMLFSQNWHDGKALIVGGNGTVLKYDGSSVSKVSNSITSNDLWGVEWDQINDYTLITGADGTVLMYEPQGGLSDISPGTTESLISLSFQNQGNDALIVGTSGTVYTYVNGGGWTLISERPFKGDFKDVAWSPNGSLALIVGSNGEILKFEISVGLTLINDNITTNTLRAIGWHPSGSYALIVGDKGTVIKYSNETNITLISAGQGTQNLLGVDFRDDGQYALVVGSFGKILKWDGSIFFTIIPEDQGQFFLFSVAFHPLDNYALVVGASGMAYKCEEDAAIKYQPAGIKCLRIATGVFTTFRDVEFKDDGSYGMLVGLSGMILKFDGSSFSQVDTEANPYSLADIKWKTGSIYPVIVGSAGIFLKYAGYGAVQMPCPAISAFNGISWHGSSAIVVGDKDQVLLYESPPLNQPFASIMSPGEGTEYTIEEPVDFSAFHSLAPDDASVQFFWLSNITGALGTTAKFSSKLPMGHHRITLYVNASGGRSDSDQVDINVILNNQPPVPIISSPIDGGTYNSTDDILFDASNSTDPNGDSLTYYWESDIEGFLWSCKICVRQLGVVNVHTITLWAYDGIFNRSTKINITIKLPNQPPEVSIVSPTMFDTIHEGDDIKFEATALDPDGDPLRYSWFSNASGFLDDHKAFLGTLAQGRQMLTFFADDAHGHNVSVSMNITVHPAIHINVPPTLMIDYPENGDMIKGIINVTGSAFDTDGEIVIIEYKIGTDTWRAAQGNETWSFEWNTLESNNGDINFKVRAYDGENHTQLERNVTIANKWKDIHVNILYPTNGQEISGDVEIQGRAFHDQAGSGRVVSMVQIRIDGGQWKLAHSVDPWVWTFKSEDFKNKDHLIEVQAMDDEGTYSHIVSITVFVENKEPALTINTDMLILFGLLILVIIIVVIVASRRASRKGGRPSSRSVDEDMDFEREMEEEKRSKAKKRSKKQKKKKKVRPKEIEDTAVIDDEEIKEEAIEDDGTDTEE